MNNPDIRRTEPPRRCSRATLRVTFSVILPAGCRFDTATGFPTPPPPRCGPRCGGTARRRRRRPHRRRRLHCLQRRPVRGRRRFGNIANGGRTADHHRHVRRAARLRQRPPLGNDWATYKVNDVQVRSPRTATSEPSTSADPGARHTTTPRAETPCLSSTTSGSSADAGSSRSSASSWPRPPAGSPPPVGGAPIEYQATTTLLSNPSSMTLVNLDQLALLVTTGDVPTRAAEQLGVTRHEALDGVGSRRSSRRAACSSPPPRRTGRRPSRRRRPSPTPLLADLVEDDLAAYEDELAHAAERIDVASGELDAIDARLALVPPTCKPPRRSPSSGRPPTSGSTASWPACSNSRTRASRSLRSR